MNLYGFVGNNPLGRVDLWGLDEDDPTDPTSDKNLNKNCPTADSGVPNWKSDLSHDTHQFINETGKEMAKSAACSVAGGVVGRGLGALRGKVGCVFKECKRLSKKAARALRKHHSWPKYLGGAEKQDLVPLEKWVHDAYHSGLDKYLPRKRGTEYYEGLKGAERQDALQKLADYTKAFDDVYGTKIYPGMIEEGFRLP